METLAFDGRMGASGDMILGALVAAGADPAVLDPVEETLDVHYEIGEVTKNGIAATSVEVLSVVEDGDEGGPRQEPDQGGDSQDDGHEQVHTQKEGHEHTHEESHDQAHGQGPDHLHDQSEGETIEHTHAEGHGPDRRYSEVREIVRGMALPDVIEADALAIFEVLGEAEANVHGTDLTDTHFHEVGADDAIADIVGTALLLDDLDVDRVVTTPLATGGGEVTMSHGTYPVPTPAVLEIGERAGWVLRGGPVESELLTPTAAAILAHVAEGVDRLPALEVTASGYGAGSKAFDQHPNVLRAVVGDSREPLGREAVTVLETNVDDVAPEVLGGLQETLGDAGALDVAVVPLTMKKSRPGHLVKVVCAPEDADAVADALAAETGTLGIREHGAGHRWIASREVESVTLEADEITTEVGVKVARDAEGTVYDASAEYDDALAVARETDLAVKEILRRAEAAWRRGE
ncbi:MAG: nickel pincer cofactor biosynthesis protein LarC [Haloarculaceae archaeon]